MNQTELSAVRGRWGGKGFEEPKFCACNDVNKKFEQAKRC